MQRSSAGKKFLDAVTIQERIDDVDLLERRLTEDPGDLIASARLEIFYRNEQAWEKLVELLLDRAEHLSSSRESATLLREVAAIYQDRLGDMDSARVVLLAAFRREPSSTETADAVDQLAYASGDWDEVTEVYSEAAAGLADLPGVASELWLRIACARITASGSFEDVASALARVRELDPERSRGYLDMVERMASGDDALAILADVCERIGDSSRRMRVLSRAAAAATDVRRKAKFHDAIGRLKLEAGDDGAAEWHLGEALQLDPSREETLEALAEIYRGRGEVRKVAEILEHSRACAQSRSSRVTLGVEAASVYHDELEERTRAIDLFAAALADDPEHVGAAVPLAERYFEQERWQELEPILDMLARKAESAIALPPADMVRLLHRAGHTASRLGKAEKARAYYEQALELNNVHLPSLLECADAYFDLGMWDCAYDTLNAALVVQRGTFSASEEFAHTLFRMGECLRLSGDESGALTLYESALDASRCDPALEAAVAIYRRRGEPEAVAQLLGAQLERVSDETRVGILCELADIVAFDLGDPRRAIEVYREALELDPGNHHVLHQLIELYSAAELWREAVQAIVLMADLETDPLRRGKYYQAAGVICRHELDEEEAVDFLNRALDCFYLEAKAVPEALRQGCLKAFADIGKVLYARREWKELERNYRRMIKRLGAGDPALPELWHGLGHLYRKHLGHRESAISSFEIAAALDEDRLTRHRILIDLYEEAGPDQLEKAIERRMRLVRAEPFNAEHYSALRSLFQKTGDMERVWCACRALVFLGAARPRELEYYRRRRPSSPTWPRVPLTDDHWALLRHPDENRLVSSILGIVAEAAALEGATPARHTPLRDDPSPSVQHLRGLFEGVRYALGVQGADGAVSSELAADVSVANARRGSQLEPAFIMGRQLQEGQTVNSIVHSLARMLTYARPVYYLRLAIPTRAELESVFLAACSLSRAETQIPAQLAPWVRTYAEAIRRRLHPDWQAQLARAVSAFAGKGGRLDLETWGYAVDATCRRVGLLLTSDLEIAVAGIAREPLFTAGPSHEDKVRDLLVHSVSPEHFRLRVALT